MGIFYGSRYRILDPIQIEDNDGETVSVHRLRRTSVTNPPIGSVRYRAKAGDTFESLAFKFYGDANKYYVLCDVNPHVFFPLDLDSGEEIIIPPKSFAEMT